MCGKSRLAFLICVVLLPIAALQADQSRKPDRAITILPAKIVLDGPEAFQRLLVQRVENGRIVGLAKGAIVWKSNGKVVSVKNGVAVPQGNGHSRITATVGKLSASCEVEVKRIDSPHQWSFRNHVQAVIAKSGCNSGSCHGALAGKGGLKLSLRGYNTIRDHHTITRQARGRRIELSDPGRSLILAKPSGGIAHKGGVRFDVGSRNYRVISQWIAAGAPGPSHSDPQVDRIEILPAQSVLQPGDAQQVLVRAHYSDGHIEDVTEWAKFTSTNETVARIDQDGRISVIGHGAGAVTAWFASKIVIARITSPFDNTIAPDVYKHEKSRNFIDELVMAKLEELRLRPSPKSSDEEFLRRAFIDTIGTLPTAAEARTFFAEKSKDKRDKLIEALLERPEFVDYWTYKWSDLLLINGQKLRPKAVESYYKWIHKHVKADTPWDEFVRLIVTSQGSSYENGATNFYALHQDPENMSENVSQAFLGLSIACAKCHNHPLEKWTNDQYYGMANLFARVRAKGWGGDFRSGDGLRTIYVSTKGDLIQPLTGKPQPPTPLDGESLSLDATRDRRVHLAKWLTSPTNPYFSRSITNRVWKNYFGVGLVEQVDDMRASNPASNEELLATTAEFLVKEKFNLKSLMRVILQSNTYQRSSLSLPENKQEQRFYSRYYPRRLMAEVLLDALSQVTEVPTAFNEIAFPGADKRKTEFYKKGTRAIQLYDSAVSSYFLKTFGRNARQITCECERSDESSMVQVLHISNGDTINEKLKTKDNALTKALATKKSDSQIVENAFLSTLSRIPTERERKQITDVLSREKKTDRRLLLEDVYWAILSSREFLFNH